MEQLKLAAHSVAKEDSPFRHEPKDNNALESSDNLRSRKISARWNPAEACRPVIDEAPMFYPTIEEFEDTLGYIAKIRPQAEPHGIYRIVPPLAGFHLAFSRRKICGKMLNFPPVFSKLICFKIGSLWGKRVGEGNESKESTPKQEHVGDLPIQFLKLIMLLNPMRNLDSNQGRTSRLKDFQQYANYFKECYFRLNDANEDGKISDSNHQKRWKPSEEEIEGECWRIIEQPTDEVEVYYGADLETGAFGSGFPKASSRLAGI